MKKRFCSVLSVVAALMLAATTVLAGSPRTSDSRETLGGSSHTPKTSESGADTRWWRPNFNEMRGADTLGPWLAPSGLTGKSWTESIFFDGRLVLNGKRPEREVSTAPRVETVAEKKPKLSAEEMGEMVANPLSYLWIGQMQNDTAV